MQIPTLTTSRLTLRAPSESDFDAFAEFFVSERSKYVGGPLTPEQSWRALATEIGHWGLRGYGRWAVEITDSTAFAGMVGLWNPLGWPEPEIGWELMNGFEGRGYATEAAQAALEFAYDRLGWSTAISLIASQNGASRAVAKRLGAVRDGEFTHERLGTMEVWRHLSSADLGKNRIGAIG